MITAPRPASRPGARLWANFTAEPSENIPSLFRLSMRTIGAWDEDTDEVAFSAEDLAQLRDLIDAALPRHAHNSKPSDPDAHVLFGSVCCSAKLYRCSRFVDAGVGDGLLPAKPIVSAGETSCTQCGEQLEEEAF